MIGSRGHHLDLKIALGHSFSHMVLSFDRGLKQYEILASDALTLCNTPFPELGHNLGPWGCVKSGYAGWLACAPDRK